MARKKAGGAVAEAQPTLTLDELKKKLIARGKQRGSLTYEEINSAFDALDDVNPDEIDGLFEEITAAGIEIIDEQKDEKPDEEEQEEPGGGQRGAKRMHAVVFRHKGEVGGENGLAVGAREGHGAGVTVSDVAVGVLGRDGNGPRRAGHD